VTGGRSLAYLLAESPGLGHDSPMMSVSILLVLGLTMTLPGPPRAVLHHAVQTGAIAGAMAYAATSQSSVTIGGPAGVRPTPP